MKATLKHSSLPGQYLFTFSIALLATLSTFPAHPAEPPLNPARVQTIAAMLGDAPTAFGAPIADRAAWGKVASLDCLRGAVRDAESHLKKPLPELPGELYLDYSKTGNRTRWQAVASRRDSRLQDFTLAECLENKGRFIKPLEEAVRAICSEPTWVYPAHDRSLKNFKGEVIEIDLRSSRVGWEMAIIANILGDKLSPATRRLMDENIRRRILDPYRRTIEGKQKMNWWMTGTNNWNAVCLAGVTGAALATLDSREERAWFIVAAEKYSKNFLRGFTSDGYCSEGLGYWNYGFGNYLFLCETIHQATAGRLDLLTLAEVRQPATFGHNIEIQNGLSPAFADCSVGSKPDPLIMYFVSRRLGLGLRRWEDASKITRTGGLDSTLMFAFPNSASGATLAPAADENLPLRTWFDKAGVLICRPGQGASSKFAVALKGGHNNEHHNHNDVGSYVVVLGDQMPLVDPGAEVYTARTFSSRRYDSVVLNSLGHPVPLVAGQLQEKGSQARATVLKTVFSEQTDTIVLDLSAAYKVPDLKTLERTFVYSRKGQGSLTITDRVIFSKPQTFGTALITLDKWKREIPHALQIENSKAPVRVQIKTKSGDGFTLESQELKEDVKTKTLPTRIGIDFYRPVKEAYIEIRITPAKQ